MNSNNIHLHILLRKYLPSIAAYAGRYITPYDWKNEYEIWEDYFRGYSDGRKLEKLKKAFRQLVAQGDIKKMPTPGFIEGMIREEDKPVFKPKPQQPPTNPAFQKIIHELVIVLGKKKRCNDEEENKKLTIRCDEIIKKMKSMSK